MKFGQVSKEELQRDLGILYTILKRKDFPEESQCYTDCWIEVDRLIRLLSVEASKDSSH